MDGVGFVDFRGPALAVDAFYLAVQPPSMVQQAPVMESLFSEHKKRTRLATSSGWMSLLTAADFSMISFITSDSGTPWASD